MNTLGENSRKGVSTEMISASSQVLGMFATLTSLITDSQCDINTMQEIKLYPCNIRFNCQSMRQNCN